MDSAKAKAVIDDDFFKFLHIIVSEFFTVLDQFDTFGKSVVIRDDFDQFWKMVRIPFTNSHTEGINIFVQLIQKSNTLNNHIVRLVNVEFHFTPGVSMTKTKLGLGGRLSTHTIHKLSKV